MYCTEPLACCNWQPAYIFTAGTKSYLSTFFSLLSPLPCPLEVRTFNPRGSAVSHAAGSGPDTCRKHISVHFRLKSTSGGSSFASMLCNTNDEVGTKRQNYIYPSRLHNSSSISSSSSLLHR